MTIGAEARKLYRLEKETREQRERLMAALDSGLKLGMASKLAERLGVSEAFLSDCRHGRRHFGIALVRELANEP